MKTDIQCPAVGAVVKSCAGRDRKRVFIVIGVAEVACEMRLIVTDGRLRPAEKPKLKNPRHVRQIGHLTDEETRLLVGADDVTLRRILVRYDGYYASEYAGKNI